MTTRFRDILTVLDNAEVHGDPSISVCGVTHDSRNVEPGSLFVAIPGDTSDGHDYLEHAVRKGATALLVQRPPQPGMEEIPWILVHDTRSVLGRVTALVYGRPTSAMALVGITGTNGKTTLTFLLESIIRSAGHNPGVVGTISYRWAGKEYCAAHTTPEASDLQRIFATMAAEGITHGLVEASSHGLHLGRLNGCEFDVGVFTNLTQDHLDYHGGLEAYYLAKRILFTKLLPAFPQKNPRAVLNLDDPYGRRLMDEIPSGIRVLTYGVAASSGVRPERVSIDREGIRGTIAAPSGSISFRSPLTGTFNLLNLLAAVAVSEQLSLPCAAVQAGIEALRVVPGRLERVPSPKGSIFVDYAHTPHAVRNVLEALENIREARIITVMGCGGDRDRTKRPLMGMEAARGSDVVVVTSDNPRSENPLDIVSQVETGVAEYGFSLFSPGCNGSPIRPGSYTVIPDRRDAIAWAVRHMGANDILLVAGKGHETYQEIGGVRYPFDDRKVVQEELAKLQGCEPQATEEEHGFTVGKAAGSSTT